MLQRSSTRAYTHWGIGWISPWDACTDTHIHTHGVALWWDIILSFRMLCYKMYLPCQSVSSNPSSVLVWCFPQGYTHHRGATHPGRWKEHGCHVINDSKILSPSFSLALLLVRLLRLAHTHTRARTRTHTPVVSWNHYTDILCGCHVHRNDDLALKLLFFTSLDSLKWILPVNYQVILFLCFTLKIILTQQYSFCLPDWKFSHY